MANMTGGDYDSSQSASGVCSQSSRCHRLIRLTLLLLVALGSAIAYVALTATINGLPPYHPFPGWVAVLQPSSERSGDKVDLEVTSDATAGHPLVGYTVAVCGPHPYRGELLIGGEAELTEDIRAFPTPPAGVTEPTLHRLPDLMLKFAGQPSFDLGAVQALPIRLGYVPPCVVTSGGQFGGGSAQGIAGLISAAIEQHWNAPFRLWSGPVASQAWPLTGTLPWLLSGEVGQFTAVTGLRGSWDLAFPQYVHVHNIYLPLTDTINSAVPVTTDPGTLDWRNSSWIRPLARLTNINYLSTLQTEAAICLVCFGVAGAWLASLTFAWLDPRRSRAAAPSNGQDPPKPRPPAAQRPHSAPTRGDGGEKHWTAMAVALLIIAAVLHRTFSTRRDKG